MIVKIDGWKVCPLICYDLRFPVFSRNTVDYDILIYLANWPIKRIDAWDTLLKARAIENQAYTIGVNRVGEDGNKVSFNGHSKVFDAFGKELLSATENKEVFQITLSMDDLNGDLWGEEDIDQAMLVEASQQVEDETFKNVS